MFSPYGSKKSMSRVLVLSPQAQKIESPEEAEEMIIQSFIHDEEESRVPLKLEKVSTVKN